jgi:hypothetical protein
MVVNAAELSGTEPKTAATARTNMQGLVAGTGK